jgi:hypothetical protein
MLDVRLNYLNPTRSLLLNALTQFGEVHVFGPGYVNEQELSVGLTDFVKRNGPFGVLLATEHIANPSDFTKKSDVEVYRRNYSFQFPQSHLSYVNQIRRELVDVSIPRVASLMETDVYRISNAALSVLNRDFDLLISPFGPQFVRPMFQMPNLSREHFAQSCNDNWFDFVSSNPHKVVPIPHFVADSECSRRPFNERPHLLSVPGTPYYARQVASASARSRGVSVAPSAVSLATKSLTRLGRPLGYRLQSGILSARQRRFRAEIRSSRFSFTCGSALGQPLRKFFEIPGNATVLLCEPFVGMEELGFVDGVNYFSVEPSEAWRLATSLDRSKSQWQCASDSGAELIASSHSVDARARQIRQVLVALLERRLAGALWRDGVFEVVSRRN